MIQVLLLCQQEAQDTVRVIVQNTVYLLLDLLRRLRYGVTAVCRCQHRQVIVVIAKGDQLLRSQHLLESQCRRPFSGLVRANIDEPFFFIRAAVQDCLHTGRITRSGQSIVCLPEQVIVTLEGKAPSPDVVLG